MTPDEAIKEMSSWELGNRLLFSEAHEKAIQLGIEALELVYELRQATAIDVEDIPSRLPSETG